MPMDMPPQQVVEYRIETPAKQSPSDFMSKAAMFIGMNRSNSEIQKPIAFVAADQLPEIDLSSKAMTQADRQGMAIAVRANSSGTLANTGVKMPDSYIAQRIHTASNMARLNAQNNASGVTKAQVQSVRCEIVGLVLDKRAGAYIKGGEQAAAKSRAALAKTDIEACKPTMREQAAQLAKGAPQHNTTPKGLASTAKQPIKLDLKAPARVSLNLKAPEKISINPAPKTKIALNLKGPSSGNHLAAQYATQKGGRGL